MNPYYKGETDGEKEPIAQNAFKKLPLLYSDGNGEAVDSEAEDSETDAEVEKLTKQHRNHLVEEIKMDKDEEVNALAIDLLSMFLGDVVRQLESY